MNDINRAHETLSNPDLKRVYDVLGHAGLDLVEAKQLDPEGARVMTQSDIVDEIRELCRREALREALDDRNQVSSGTITLVLDASDGCPEVVRYAVSQSFNWCSDAHWSQLPEYQPVDSTGGGHGFRIDGSAVCENARGAATCSMEYHQQLSESTEALARYSLGSRASSGMLQVEHRISQADQMKLQLSSDDGEHSLDCSLEHQFSPDSRGSLRYNLDEDGLRMIQVGAVWRGFGSTIFSTYLSMQEAGPGLKCDIRGTVLPGVSCSLACHTSSRGIKIEAGFMGQVSAFTELGLSFSVSSQDLSTNLKYKRFGHQLCIPVRLSGAPSALAVSGTCLAYVAALVSICGGFVQPQNKQREVQSMVHRAKKTCKQRRRALQERKHMADSAIEKKQIEKTKGGLVIHLAVFGVLPDHEILQMLCNCSADDRWIAAGAPYTDVTIALQHMVGNQSRLHLDGGLQEKSRLPGWFDPCPEHKGKQLYIAYSWRNLSFAHVFDGDDEISNDPKVGDRTLFSDLLIAV